MRISKSKSLYVISLPDIHVSFDSVKFDSRISSADLYLNGRIIACLYDEKAKQLKEYWEQQK